MLRSYRFCARIRQPGILSRSMSTAHHPSRRSNNRLNSWPCNDFFSTLHLTNKSSLPSSPSSSSSSSSSSSLHGPDSADIGRTIQVLTTRLPHILREGVLPSEILSDSVTLELLPSTLGLPEIKGKTAYTTLSRLATWSVTTLLPSAQVMIDSQRLIGSARRCECLLVRFRLIDAGRREEKRKQETLYTGLFHFYFDGRGKVARHVFEVVDGRFTPAHLVNWVMGQRAEKSLGVCYQNYERKSS